MLDAVEFLSNIKKITALGQSTKDKQISISVSDVWNGWDLLVAKYDLIEIINVLYNFAKDDDLKLIITNILKFVEQGAANLENTMAEYAIPLPPRPRQGSYSSTNLETITDKYIFVRLFRELKSLCPIILTGCLNSTSPVPIKDFKKHLLDTITIIDNISVYGELKGYIGDLPAYMPS